MVDRRWAMTMQVRPSRALSKASCTVCEEQKNTQMNLCSHTHTHTGRSHYQFSHTAGRHAVQLQQFHNHVLITIITMFQWIHVLLSVFELEQLPHGPTDHIHPKEAPPEARPELL